MKRLILGASLASASMPAAALADAYISVVTRPREPPPPPLPERVETRAGWVWIGGHYEWRQREYVWVGGRLVPERHGHVWREGHWRQHGHVYRWHRGGWRPRR